MQSKVILNLLLVAVLSIIGNSVSASEKHLGYCVSDDLCSGLDIDISIEHSSDTPQSDSELPELAEALEVADEYLSTTYLEIKDTDSSTNLYKIKNVRAVVHHEVQKPILTIESADSAVFQNGKLATPIEFWVDSNFPDFVQRWQLEIYHSEDEYLTTPLHTIEGGSPLLAGTPIVWGGEMDQQQLNSLDLDVIEGVKYRLTVYNIDSEKAQTRLIPINFILSSIDLISDNLTWHEKMQGRNDLESFEFKYIGSLVEITANDLSTSEFFDFHGHQYPIDYRGDVKLARHFGPGNYRLDYSWNDAYQQLKEDYINIEVKGEYFFLMALADFHLGGSSGFASELVTEDNIINNDEFQVDGRLGFFLKGKVKGKY